MFISLYYKLQLIMLSLLLGLNELSNGRMQNFALPASAYRIRYYNPPKCTDPITNRELYVGDFYTRMGQCIRVQCLGNLQIWEDHCQVPQVESNNCTRIPPANEFLDYPNCCATFECHSFSTTQNSEIETHRFYDHMGKFLREQTIQRFLVLVDPLLLRPEITKSKFRIQ